MLLRSDAPHHGDPSPPLATWPPRTVLDLRSSGETDGHHPLAADGAAIHAISLSAGASLGHLAQPGGAPPTIVQMYEQVLGAGVSLARLAGLVAAGPWPVLVHCTAGKDRTGILIAVLLRAVGVPREAIVSDYELTAAAMPGVVARIRSSAPLDGHGIAIDRLVRERPDLMTTSRKAIEIVLDGIDGREGGAGGWLLSHGLTPLVLDRLRTRLVERPLKITPSTSWQSPASTGASSPPGGVPREQHGGEPHVAGLAGAQCLDELMYGRVALEGHVERRGEAACARAELVDGDAVVR